MPRRSSTPSFEEVKSNTAQLASQLHQLNTRVTNVFSAYKRQDVKTNNVSKNKQDILDQLSKQIELTKAAYDQELDTLREKMKTERDARILAEGYLGSVTAVLDKGKLSEAEELKHIEELQASLKEIQEKLAEKASQIAKDEVYQESLINSNSNLKNYIEKLSDDWKNLLGFSEEVRSHLLDYKSDASSVAELIALFRKGKETKVAALEKEAFELQSYIDSMEMKLKYEFTNDLNELIANNQKHFEAQKNSALEERKNRFESSISELNAHYQRKDARISELEESLVALEKDIADYEGKCDEYEDQNENLNSQLGDIEANILKMKKSSSKRVDTKLNELEKLKAELEQVESELSDIEKSKVDLMKEIERYQQLIGEEKERLAEMNIDTPFIGKKRTRREEVELSEAEEVDSKDDSSIWHNRPLRLSADLNERRIILIKNHAEQDVNLNGWRVVFVEHEFEFMLPDTFLHAGETISLYYGTAEYHQEHYPNSVLVEFADDLDVSKIELITPDDRVGDSISLLSAFEVQNSDNSCIIS